MSAKLLAEFGLTTPPPWPSRLWGELYAAYERQVLTGGLAGGQDSELGT
jgi:hypothetical protein